MPKSTWISENSSKSVPDLITATPELYLISATYIWSWPPKHRSTPGTLSANILSFGNLMWVRAMITSHPYSSLKYLAFSFATSTPSVYMNSSSIWGGNSTNHSSSAIPKNPILSLLPSYSTSSTAHVPKSPMGLPGSSSILLMSHLQGYVICTSSFMRATP